MAAVYIPPSPQPPAQTMSNRRAPLANVPNGTNSPRRGVQHLAASKRPHPGNSQQENGSFQEPPPKRQMVDQVDGASKSSLRRSTQPALDSKLFTRKNENAPPSAFERKLVAAREKERQASQRQPNGAKNTKVAGPSMDSIRQWQKHYRKAFPQFVFYFESVPDDIRYKFSREVKQLGAHEEKFFSKAVTHVVTSRPIPVDIDTSRPPDGSRDTTSQQNQNANGPVETVNPTLLDRAVPQRGSKARNHVPERQEPATNMNILYRAKRMNMKIWPLDKLQRVVSTMNDTDVAPPQGQTTRNHNAGHGRGRAENDLSLALRSEKVHSYADRDTSRGIVPFKGPYIYVHDMEEKTRPVAVREYQKVAKREDGSWPQFRSAPVGKCPFLMDEPKKEPKQEQKQQQKPESKPAANKTKEPMAAPPKAAPPKAAPPPEPAVKQSTQHDAEEQAELENHPEIPGYPNTTTGLRNRPGSPRKNPELPQFTTMDMAHLVKGNWAPEPAASGVQPSNITSAIRSQMVSSTAGVNGVKAGTSKEVHELKRKVLEKSNAIALGGKSNPQKTAEMTVEDRPTRAPVPRAAKMKAQGNLGPIKEDSVAQPTTREGNGGAKQGAQEKADNGRNGQNNKRDPKPGYCENCREKFDDFEEHVTTRKHRKFALNPSNWTELDDLLELLPRPFQ